MTLRVESGRIVGSRGAGGLAAGLGDIARDLGATWVAAAVTDGDREAARQGGGSFEAEGIRLRYLDLEAETFDRYYNGLSNRVLWFCHHYLWDVPNAPAFGRDTLEAWDAYRAVNARFADSLLAAAGEDAAAFLVQDYHLCLVPALLRARRPDARISHFTHVPFADPSYFAILPDAVGEDLLRGMLGADVLGFHSAAWARNFLECCRRLRGARVDARRRTVALDDRIVRVDVNPMTPDVDVLRDAAGRPAVRIGLASQRGDAERLVFRADRMELSKNVVRGFRAYERLLELRPDWRRRVRFVAHLYPSREAVPEYAAYADACASAARRVNERFGEDDWTPVDLVVRDDFDEVLAGYLDYDVLLVNPVFDGLNLVAKEGPAVNRRDGVLVLSRNAGAVDELGRHALVVNPFDVEATAAALGRALDMPAAERRRRARGLVRVVASRHPRDWAERQLEALSRD